MRKVVVIGGGPSGMMAAGQAAERGAAVLLLEKTKSPGRKLRLTGNGRCNLTNTLAVADFIEHVHGNGKFLRHALAAFTHENLVEFFRRLNLETVTDPNGRVYPVSGRAVDVLTALTRWLTHVGVVTHTKTPVEDLVSEGKGIAGVRTSAGVVRADAVIIATGGASYPETGSAGDGYRLAESVGHTIVPIRPSLVPLEIAGSIPARLQGISVPSVSVGFRTDDDRVVRASGEILFTHFGVSGPVILRISRKAVDTLATGKGITLSVDLMPEKDAHYIDKLLSEIFQDNGRKMVHNILGRLLPDRLAAVLLESCGLSGEITGSQVTASARADLVRLLKDFQLEVDGPRPLAEAIVTAGGVNTREIDPRSMCSRLVRGLYFAGEVVDVDGDSGGFNIQMAFSTGWVAGQSAGEGAVKQVGP